MKINFKGCKDVFTDLLSDDELRNASVYRKPCNDEQELSNNLILASLLERYQSQLPKIEVQVKMALQGAHSDTGDCGIILPQMRDDLRANNLIPLSQPYVDCPFSYNGTETITDSSVLSDRGNESIVDWILVELRDKNNASIVLETKAGLLRKDYRVVDVDGSSNLIFNLQTPDDYFISVRHRNHLGVMSLSPISLDYTVNEVDFRTIPLYESGDISEKPSFVDNNVQMLWAGDILQIGMITDKSRVNFLELISTNPNNTFGSDSFNISNVYHLFDANMNGGVRYASSNNDSCIIYSNITNSTINNPTSSVEYEGLQEHLPSKVLPLNIQNLKVKVFLEGAYIQADQEMQTKLNEYHLLPGQDLQLADSFVQQLGTPTPTGNPYAVAPFNYSGIEANIYGDGNGKIAYPEDVVDLVLVTIRKGGLLPANDIWTGTGLLKKTGEIEIVTNYSIPFGNADYHIIVQHRNHLPVMSEAIKMQSCNLSYDFTRKDSYVSGSSDGQKQIGSTNIYVMFAGNGDQVNSRTTIDTNDATVQDNDNGQLFKYMQGDYNMNADCNSSDDAIVSTNTGKTTTIQF